MPHKRTTYTAEFKLQAVRMITDQKRSVAEVARRLVHPDLLSGVQNTAPRKTKPCPGLPARGLSVPRAVRPGYAGGRPPAPAPVTR
ncbi:MAG TPA: transposase [Urbifossiella sp.]|jgi:hypothetical protein|nr:transposase [Urbifossiella sp.]